MIWGLHRSTTLPRKATPLALGAVIASLLLSSASTRGEDVTPVIDQSQATAVNEMATSVASDWFSLAANSIGTLIFTAIVVTTVTIAVVSWWRARRELTRVEAIRRQLGAWARDRYRSIDCLERVHTIGPECYGWNLVLDKIQALRQEAAATVHPLVPELPAVQTDEVLNDLPDGIAVVENDGTVSFFNESLEVLLADRVPVVVAATDSGPEYSTETRSFDAGDENRSRSFDRESLPHLLRELTSDRQLLVRKPSVEILEGRGRSDGRILRLSRQPRWTRDRHELRGTIWTVRDITQQKLVERMRDEFLDSATHELRTPLANIKAYAETLAISDVIAVEQQKEFCNTINAEATRLARLIDDLLSISSMEVGSLSVDCQRTEVDRLLKEVVGRVRPTMDMKQQKFHALIDPKIPEMKLDKDKFSTILVNLLGNAAKYTPEKGNVTMRAACDETHLTIEVEDTGVGITAAELPRIFEKFFRSSDPRVQCENGTGLGLSLTQELVRLHGGLLNVRSQPNQGTCFTIRIPL